MSSEKFILAIVAILAGLLVAGAGFYFYQSTKTIQPSDSNSLSITPPTPTSTQINSLTITAPIDEEVVDKKTITVSGTTVKGSIVIITTDSEDKVVTPAQNGSFTTTIGIDDGQNVIEISAILPNGKEIIQKRTVTFSTENF